MGGYVTDSRNTPGYIRRPLRSSGAGWEPLDRFSQTVRKISTGVVGEYPGFQTPETTHNKRYHMPQQVTTSFRTRGGEDPDLELRGTGSTWASANRSLRLASELRDTTYDQGHEFDTTREDMFIPSYGYVLMSHGYELQGHIAPEMGYSSHGPYPVIDPDLASLKAMGQEGINRTIPTNSPADLAQALIELKREGLPSLIGLPTLRNRDLGSEYLNYQFGIKPLIRDLQALLRSIANSSEILQTYQEESGKKLHRQYTFPTVKFTHDAGSSTTGRISAWPFGLTSSKAYLNNGYGTLSDVYETEVKTWFHGAYTYYLQGNDCVPVGRLHELARNAKYLLGLELTPELLWEVTPWSWLSDWVTNIGVNISNAQALSEDGLVLRYGYVMRETTVSRFRDLTGLNPTVEGPRSCSAVYRTVRKQRIRATPYGFGLNPATFSGRQWAILGALGMTRGTNSLRLSD